MKTERIQLDQALQFLFRISDRMTVNLINGLFRYTFHIEFQLKENPHMTNRMVEYGVTRALKNLKESLKVNWKVYFKHPKNYMR